jgi:hypothetical protein
MRKACRPRDGAGEGKGISAFHEKGFGNPCGERGGVGMQVMTTEEAIGVLQSVRRNEEQRNNSINKLCNNPSVSIGVCAIDIAIQALREKAAKEGQG